MKQPDRRTTPRASGMRAVGVALTAAAIGAGCAPRGGPAPTRVEFWTTDHEQDRMAIQRKLARRFETVHPQWKIQVIGVPENDLPKRLAAYRAAGRSPEVIRLGLELVAGYAEQGILDPSAASRVVAELGEDTFFAGPLRLLRMNDGRYAAVPIDGWVQCLWYRRDLFEKAGLDPPATWDAMLKAARALNEPDERSYGIVLGTDPQQVYTQQTFEHLALSGGLRLFDAEGRPALERALTERVFAFYRDLADCGPPGNCYWREARKYYLSGRAAMVFYSPYIVDDIAGFAEGQDPVADLARHTDFVSVIEGHGGNSASYGQVVSLALTPAPDEETAAAARAWVKFLLSDAYLEICNMSPGGKVPVRKTVVAEWKQHPYFRHYPRDLPDRLAGAMDGLQRWGWRDGRRFPAITDVCARKIVPAAVGEVLRRRMEPSRAFERLQNELKAILPPEP